MRDAIEVVNRRAPEHLQIVADGAERIASAIRNAGAIFLGDDTPEPVGDYIAGPSHVLPTAGTARYASPLGVYDFVKRTSIIRYAPERLAADADAIIALAEAEGLFGHAEAVRMRVAGKRGGGEGGQAGKRGSREAGNGRGGSVRFRHDWSSRFSAAAAAGTMQLRADCTSLPPRFPAYPLPRVGAVLALTVAFMFVEAVGGWISGSLALLADAGHMLTDAGALGLTLLSAWIALRPASQSKTYGYQRWEILAALINGAALFGIAGWVVIEAIQRIQHPEPIRAGLFLVVAAGGLAGEPGQSRNPARHPGGEPQYPGCLPPCAGRCPGVGRRARQPLRSSRLTGWTLADPIVSIASRSSSSSERGGWCGRAPTSCWRACRATCPWRRCSAGCSPSPG